MSVAKGFVIRDRTKRKPTCSTLGDLEHRKGEVEGRDSKSTTVFSRGNVAAEFRYHFLGYSTSTLYFKDQDEAIKVVTEKREESEQNS